MARAAQLGGRFDAVVFGFCVLVSLVFSGMPDQMRDPIASTLRRTIVAPLIGMQRSAERWRAAWLESERQALQRDSVGMHRATSKALEIENDRLRKLLGLGGRLGWGFVPAEALHTEGRSEEVITSVTLTAGSRQGVAQYSPVVTAEGVVGLIQTVDPKISIAILYSHPDFRVSGMSADGSAFGIVYPHLNVASTRLSERYLLELRNVEFRNSLAMGTEIFSSGVGGAWPKGVLIGTVIDTVPESETYSRTYLLRPAVNPAHVTSVMILTSARVAQGVGNVWSLTPPPETARPPVRRDSVKRDSVKKDSVRADSIRPPT